MFPTVGRIGISPPPAGRLPDARRRQVLADRQQDRRCLRRQKPGLRVGEVVKS